MLFTSSIISTLALAAAPVLAIPPPIFGFPDSDNHTELGVAYTLNGNKTVVQEAMLFGYNITQTQPQLSLDPAQYKSVADYNGQYVIIMVDPDASTPEDPSRRFILHWLATNVTQSTNTNDTRSLSPPSASGTGIQDFVSYNPPTPGNTSSAHRYILYAFQQPADFSVPADFGGLQGGQNRSNFNLTNFINASGLDRPAAAEYFYVNRQSQVPGDFVALAGGEYPGGNGGAIFENSPDAAGNGSSNGTETETGKSAAGPVRAMPAIVEGIFMAGIWGLAIALL